MPPTMIESELHLLMIKKISRCSVTSGFQKQFFSVKIVFALFFICQSPAQAQQFDLSRRASRASLRSPGISIVSKLPTATVRAMRVNNGRLFLAGLDQVVRSYPINPNGDINIEECVVYRWPSAREFRGTIQAIAVNWEGTKLAVGGMGLSNALVCEIDLRTGQILHSDHRLKFDVTQIEYGPDNTIWYGTSFGGLVHWDTSGEGKIILPESTKRIYICGIVPTPNGCLAVKSNGRVHLIENQVERRVISFSKSEGEEVQSISPINGPNAGFAYISVDQARKSNLIGQWTKDSDRPKVLREERFDKVLFRKLFLTKANKLYACGLRAEGRSEIKDYADLLLCNVEERKENAIDRIPYLERMEKPNSFAVVGSSIFFGGPGTFLRQYKVESNKDGVTIEKNCPSTSLRDVQWGLNQGFSWRRDGSNYSFDPKSRQLLINQPPIKPSFVKSNQLTRVAKVELTARYASQAAVTFKSGKTSQIDPGLENYGYVTAIKMIRYDERDFILAGHLYGVSIFRVGDDDKLVIVRRMFGHSDYVSSIDVNVDKGLVLTSGDDGSICCFSLAPWKFHSELGASFSILNGRLRVSSIDTGSPIWETGLDEGEEIEKLWYMGQPLDPEKALVALRNPQVGQQFQFKTARLGVSTRCVQRPIWKFYNKDSEWVWWRWQDFYYDCSQNGERLIQWYINQGFQTPIVINGTEARSRFYRPLKLQDLLSRAETAPERINIPELIPPAVTLAIDDKNDHFLVRTSLEVEQNALLVGEPRELSVWVNDHRIANWSQPSIGDVQECRIDKEVLRSGKNLVIARAFNRIGVRGDSKAYVIDSPPTDVKPVMRSLAIGVRDYRNSRFLSPDGRQMPFRNLKYTVRDAKSITQLLKGQAGGYENVDARILTNDEATGANVIRQIEEIGKASRPDDIFVFSFSGHGHSIQESVDSSLPQTFLLLTSNANLVSTETTLKTALPIGAIDQGEEQPSVFNSLAKLPCRKIVFIDACYSGGALEVVKSLTPDLVVGPTIYTASQASQQSHEIDTKANGIFTETISEAISEQFQFADRSGDLKISARELFDYTSKRVPEIFNNSQLFISPDAFVKGQKPDFWSPEEDQDRPVFVRVVER